MTLWCRQRQLQGSGWTRPRGPVVRGSPRQHPTQQHRDPSKDTISPGLSPPAFLRRCVLQLRDPVVWAQRCDGRARPGSSLPCSLPGAPVKRALETLNFGGIPARPREHGRGQPKDGRGARGRRTARGQGRRQPCYGGGGGEAALPAR